MRKCYNSNRAIEIQENQMKQDSDIGIRLNVNIGSTDISNKPIVKVPLDKLYSAPSSFNFFEPLNKDKSYELTQSIIENGLLNPIIVWKIDKNIVEEYYQENEVDLYNFTGQSYMILSGHNRTNIFKQLSNYDDKYKNIDCYIYEDIDPVTASNFVLDTNYVQRVLSPYELKECIDRKYVLLKNSGVEVDSIARMVMDDLDLTKTKYYEYKKISETIPEIQDLWRKSIITQNNTAKSASLDRTTQKYLYDKIESLSKKEINAILSNIKPKMDIEDIDNIVENIVVVEKVDVKNIITRNTYHINKNKQEEFLLDLFILIDKYK